MKGTTLVIGAGGGGGGAVVHSLLKSGVDVVGTVANESEEAATMSKFAGIRRLVRVDLANGSAVADGMDDILADPAMRKLTAVVVCAGISPFGPVEITPVERLRLTLEINTIAPVIIYQKCLPLLRKSKGRYVVTTSMAGRVGIPFIGHYSASKFALEALADVMRREARRWKVEVIVVEPGSIKSSMVSDQVRQVDAVLAQLSAAQLKLYRHMFERWREIVDKGYESAFPPEYFAKAVMKALTDKQPKTRYISDPIGRAVIEAGRRMSDRRLDGYLQKIFG